MNIALLYYDGFSEFEIVIMALLFKRHNLIAVALENREYRSEENQRYCFDQLVRDVNVDSIDLLVILGGDPALLVGNKVLKTFIEQLACQEQKSSRDLRRCCGSGRPGIPERQTVHGTSFWRGTRLSALCVLC